MLGRCNNCRKEQDIKIRLNPVKSETGKHVPPQTRGGVPVCQECGSEVALTQFMINRMIAQKDYLEERTAKKNSVRCHACDINVEAALDSDNNPRCCRCKTQLKISPMMVNVLKEAKAYLSDEEMESYRTKVKQTQK